MSQPLLAGVRIVLSFQSLNADPKAFEDLVSAILTLGPTSSLAAQQAVKDELVNLDTTHKAYTAASKAAAASGAQHVLDVEEETRAKGACNRSINLLRTLTENGSVTPGDVKGMGFMPYDGPPPEPDFVAPVTGFMLGKVGSGKATAFVNETSTTRPRYAAETSPDGIDGWAVVLGGRKTRKLRGAPGTRVWVRFALQRGALQTEWSTPMLITFP